MRSITDTAGGDVLIVIPSLNESAHIASVIRSLQADTGCPGATIVLADGGSRDDTVAIVEAIGREDPRVKALATDTPLGISASVNKAVRMFGAGKTWLVRIDAHAEYPPNYASQLVERAVEKGADSVVTPMITKGSSCFQQAAAAAQNSLLGTGGAAHRHNGHGGGWVDHGHHALMKIDIFARVGGYDETFTHNEDAELDKRIGHAGGRIWLASDLALVYYPRKTTKSLYRQYFYYGRGRAMTVARHGGRHLRQMLPLAIAPMVALAVLAPFSLWAALPAAAWIAASLLYGLALGTAASPCAAGAGYAAIVMHLAWSLGYWKQILAGPRPGDWPAPLPLEEPAPAVTPMLRRRAEA